MYAKSIQDDMQSLESLFGRDSILYLSNMRSVLSYPFFVASLEFVAKERLTVGRTRNPDCERGRALGKLELRLGLGGMCWGDLCPNDTLCASNLTWARTSFWGRCAQPVSFVFDWKFN